ncbi:hypothetical protein LTR84_002499 [Exophiala bonariae]|uniref:Profilin n=1 Tax=Exophiala bonariae TaxID=1690606 RepID=A0AAV9NDN2_9EURO|nr:hypothetical protein LTR84_002499 [Exophiala bonariae]
MSWQAYVDTSLIGTGDVDQAAIFNSEGTSVWATSTNFNVTPQELKDIVAGFKDAEKVQSSGVHVAGVKYMTIKADDSSIYGKKGREGVIIRKTKQALLVAHYPATVQPGTATNTVEKLGDYLIGVGY